MATSLPRYEPQRVEVKKIRGGRKVCYIYDIVRGDTPTVDLKVHPDNASLFHVVFEVTGTERHIIHRSKSFENDIKEKLQITKKDYGSEMKYFKVEFSIKDKSLRKTFSRLFEAVTPPSSQEDNSS